MEATETTLLKTAEYATYLREIYRDHTDSLSCNCDGCELDRAEIEGD